MGYDKVSLKICKFSKTLSEKDNAGEEKHILVSHHHVNVMYI